MVPAEYLATNGVFGIRHVDYITHPTASKVSVCERLLQASYKKHENSMSKKGQP